MPKTQRFGVKFSIRESAAGIHYLALDPVHEDYRKTLGCDSLHLLPRDGIGFAALESLVRDLNSSIETITVHKT